MRAQQDADDEWLRLRRTLVLRVQGGGDGQGEQGGEDQVTSEVWTAIGSAGGTIAVLLPLQLKTLSDIADLRERMARVEEQTEDLLERYTNALHPRGGNRKKGG